MYYLVSLTSLMLSNTRKDFTGNEHRKTYAISSNWAIVFKRDPVWFLCNSCIHTQEPNVPLELFKNLINFSDRNVLII